MSDPLSSYSDLELFALIAAPERASAIAAKSSDFVSKTTAATPEKSAAATKSPVDPDSTAEKSSDKTPAAPDPSATPSEKSTPSSPGATSPEKTPATAAFFTKSSTATLHASSLFCKKPTPLGTLDGRNCPGCLPPPLAKPGGAQRNRKPAGIHI